MFVWWHDVLRESTTSIWFDSVHHIGGHVPFCSFSIFFSFFFSTYGRDQRYLSPKGIRVLDTREIPFLNTPIILATISLALVSTGFQGMEYYQAPPTISDSIYDSTFSIGNLVCASLLATIEWMADLSRGWSGLTSTASWDRAVSIYR
ncbi:hypothetical protein AMTRI_Chr01g130040 [Amborella trichopoda]